MTTKTARKERTTVTLSRESLRYLTEIKQERRGTSTSAVLDELLLEMRQKREMARHEAAIGAYYDRISDEEAAENEAWGKFVETQFPTE